MDKLPSAKEVFALVYKCIPAHLFIYGDRTYLGSHLDAVNTFFIENPEGGDFGDWLEKNYTQITISPLK